MSEIKLFSQNAHTMGRTVTLPVVGDVTFDSEKNFIEVDSEKADLLLEKDFGLILSKKDPNSPEVNSHKENLAMLETLTDIEIEDLLKSYPSKDLKNLKSKNQKIEYLAKQMAK